MNYDEALSRLAAMGLKGMCYEDDDKGIGYADIFLEGCGGRFHLGSLTPECLDDPRCIELTRVFLLQEVLEGILALSEEDDYDDCPDQYHACWKGWLVGFRKEAEKLCQDMNK